MIWTRLITRTLILLLIVAVGWISKDTLLRKALIRSGQSVTGAKIEIGHLRSDLWTGQIYLQDVAIADPRDPLQNLFQADLTYLEIDPARLWHRELVVNQGTASQVRFGVPRTRSGALQPADTIQPTSTEIDREDVRGDSVDRRDAWSGQFSRTAGVEKMELAKTRIGSVAGELKANWPQWLEKQQQLVAELRQRLIQLQTDVEHKGRNPLRNTVSVEQVNAQYRELESQLAQAVERISRFRTEADLDLARLERARTADLESFAGANRSSRFDSQLISEILLQQVREEHAVEVVNWFRWFRRGVPDPRRDFRPAEVRGENVHLPAVAARPRFLIKAFELDGEGRVAGRHFNFSGSVHNVSTEPDRVDAPVTFSVRAQGPTHVVIDCELDRRTEPWKDSMRIRCPRMDLDSRQLGDPNSLAVRMTPCRLESDVRLQAVGDQVSGKIVFRYTDLMMQIERLELPETIEPFIDEANLELASLNQIEIEARLSGDLERPQVQLESDLGAEFANVLNRILERRDAKLRMARKEQLERLYQAEKSKFEQAVIMELDQLLRLVNHERQQMDRIAERLPDSKPASGIRR